MSVIKTNLPLADEGQAWSASDAIASVKEWATDDSGDIDFDKYRKAFFFVDDDNDGDDSGGEKQGDYKLPFAMVIDGKLQAVWNGVAACMAAINGARGGIDLGDDENERQGLYDQICAYYKKFDKEPPELSKSASGEVVKRDVGERVDVFMNIDQTSVKDAGDGSFSAVITTSGVDRHMESIDTAGITTDNYMANPVVLYGHDYSGLPIGKATKLYQFKNSLKANFQLAVKEYPFAATVAEMIKSGYLNAVSIGGVVRRWSDDYSQILEMEMVEFSIVPVPANPQALITSRSFEKAIGKDEETVQREFTDFVEKSTAKKLAGLDTDELDRHIKSLEEVTATLKSARAEKAGDTPTKIVLRKAASQASYHSQQIIRLTKAKKG